MPSPIMPRDALRYRTLWLALGCAGAALVVYLSLTPAPHHVVRVPSGDKLEHVLAFAVPTWWFGQLYPSAKGRLRVAVVALVAAVLLELGQKLIGGYRDIEYGDVLASGAGVLLGQASLLHPLLGDTLARVDDWLVRRRT